jgi:putative ABC transport system substrate-binding protein
MTTKFLMCLLTTALLSVAPFVQAQQAGKVARIGILSSTPSAAAQRLETFRQGLRDLGWVEGKNIIIEYRYSEGRIDREPELAAELVRLKVDVIFVGGAQPALAAKKATTTIPIVMAYAGDPVGLGLVASLARPGGNVTGLSSLSDEVSTKRLELLKEIVPKLSRVAVLWNPQAASSARSWQAIQPAARELGIQLHSLEVRSSKDFDKAFEDATRARAGALAIMPGSPFGLNLKRIAEFAAKSRLPSIFGETRFVDSGGLAAYAEDRSYNFRRAAFYVDKILKGTKPADLPVEQPMKFEFVINLKTAKQIGLTIPPNVLVRADKVIK